MKTRTIFEPYDFEGSGQMIIRDVAPAGKVHIESITICYKVGWMIGRASKKGNHVMLISLSDGMVMEFASNKALCDHLNHDDLGFLPMTTEEISTMLGQQGNRF
jgi:hypothetical protein